MSTSVTVITASFNNLDGLTKTAESLRIQAHPLEWIVVDADSGPNVRKFLTNFESDNINLNWISEKDRGLFDGMNKGFALSSGEIILFLNTGDVLATPEVISEVVKSYESENWSWAVGLALRFNENLEPHQVWEYLNPTLGGLAIGTRTFCHQACFYRRELLNQVMPYAIDNLAADHLLNIRAFKRTKPTNLLMITTFFQDGGISSQRTFRVAMRDLQRVRKKESILIFNSLFLDTIFSYTIVFFVNLSGLMHRVIRRAQQQIRSNDRQ
jgi:glycosyltransferase involved in cell wall biosynthesis